MGSDNLGTVLKDEGDLDAALNEYRKALAICESVLGIYHPNTACCYHSIGSVLMDKGEYETALVEQGKALEIR